MQLVSVLRDLRLSGLPVPLRHSSTCLPMFNEDHDCAEVARWCASFAWRGLAPLHCDQLLSDPTAWPEWVACVATVAAALLVRHLPEDPKWDKANEGRGIPALHRRLRRRRATGTRWKTSGGLPGAETEAQTPAGARRTYLAGACKRPGARGRYSRRRPSCWSERLPSSAEDGPRGTCPGHLAGPGPDIDGERLTLTKNVRCQAQRLVRFLVFELRRQEHGRFVLAANAFGFIGLDRIFRPRGKLFKKRVRKLYPGGEKRLASVRCLEECELLAVRASTFRRVGG